jgi:hypothetical protein
LNEFLYSGFSVINNAFGVQMVQGHVRQLIRPEQEVIWIKLFGVAAAAVDKNMIARFNIFESLTLRLEEIYF